MSKKPTQTKLPNTEPEPKKKDPKHVKRARKYWMTDLNYFRGDTKSTWKYEPFENKKTKEVTLETIAELLVKGEIVDSKLKPKNVEGPAGPRGTRMHRTYVYRAAVEFKVYDGNASSNKKGIKPKTKGNWKVIDQAIEKWNKEFGKKGLEIKDGELKQFKKGRKESTPADLLKAFRGLK